MTTKSPSFTVILSVQLYDAGQKYLSYPTQTESLVISMNEMPFPAFSFCNPNPISRTAIDNIKKNNFTGASKSLQYFIEQVLLLMIHLNLYINSLLWNPICWLFLKKIICSVRGSTGILCLKVTHRTRKNPIVL